MVQVPFEVRVEGHEVEPSPDLDAPAVTKAEVADDVSAELRKHFARYPIAPTTRPRTTEPAPAQDFQLVLDNGVQRALRIPDLSCEALLAWAWQVVVVVPLGAFFVSLMTEAGKDAYLALKRLMHRLHTTAAHRQGSAPDIPNHRAT